MAGKRERDAGTQILVDEWSPAFLRGVLDAAPEGIAICDARGADQPVAYLNAAFARLTGYGAAELIGQDLRCLQGSDREQEARTQLREAIARGETCRALLRNYRKDGALFWNELLLQPLRAGGDERITHFIGFHRDVSERERTGSRQRPGMPTWMREDRLSGLCSRGYFEELLAHDWTVGERETRVLTLILFDIDELGSYNDTFGRAAGDACIRRVAGVIGAAFKRGADVVARWDGGRICALVRSAEVSGITAFAGAIAQRVLGQRIHHPRATRQRFVSVSVGAASLTPASDRAPEAIVAAAARALQRAKQDSEARVAIATAEELA
jgi:diguanylate cyclase (GGDEF)-like protein/PAS domain S-box-containing protein